MAKKRLRIFAFGGNEVAPVGVKDPKTGKEIVPDIALQWQKTVQTCKLVADIIEKYPDDLYIMTHGNGPQVGNILLRAEYSRPILPSLPLDVCGADTQGAMGFMLSNLLCNELRMRGIQRLASALVTQVVVDKDDPDFKSPSKYVGPTYGKDEALSRKEKDGWAVKCYKKDAAGVELWRRVVPSPVPIDIVELPAVEALLQAGIIPVTVGGGGIPVNAVKPKASGSDEAYEVNYGISFKKPKGAPSGKGGHPPSGDLGSHAQAEKVYSGVEAVIDKDLASALLGNLLLKGAKARGEDREVTLTIFTGEDGAKLNYQKPDQVDLRKLTVKEAAEIYNRKPCPFPAGSMGPKIKAAIKFIEDGGHAAYISKTDLFDKTLAGTAGTTIIP